MQAFFHQFLSGEILQRLPGIAWKGLEILLITGAGWGVYRLLAFFILRGQQRLLDSTRLRTNEHKLRTANHMLLLALRILIGFFVVAAVFYLLNLTGVLMSLLATAGIGGLIIAFGAQSVVKDFIAGLLLAMADQIALGDFVQVNGVTGTVEGMTVRTVQIRGLEQELFTIHAGEITMVTNYSRGEPLALVEVPVPYTVHLPTAKAVILDEMAAWAKAHPDIARGEPAVEGASQLADSCVLLRAVCRVRSDKKPEAEWQLKALLKERLEREGMAVPYPHLVVLEENGKGASHGV